MNSEITGQRSGVLAGGNWIVDQVKIVDTYPAQDQLANIFSQSQGTGGSPFNILIDLAKLGAEFSLHACGMIGDDAPGEWIIEQCHQNGIRHDLISKEPNISTSYTDVMTVQATGRRTFFHQRGANAKWDGSELNFSQSNAKIFHLGYLLLLDEMDKQDPDFGTKGAKLLSRAQESGLKTSIDVVSEDSDRFASVVKPALKYSNYAILNEIESGKTTGESIRRSDNSLDKDALVRAVDAMFEAGVKDLIVIHFPEGSYAKAASGEAYWQTSLKLPEDYIKGGAGAGDAFCAGTLFGIHQDFSVAESLKLGVGAAATCLSDPTCTGGVASISKIKELESSFGFRDSI